MLPRWPGNARREQAVLGLWPRFRRNIRKRIRVGLVRQMPEEHTSHAEIWVVPPGGQLLGRNWSGRRALAGYLAALHCSPRVRQLLQLLLLGKLSFRERPAKGGEEPHSSIMITSVYPHVTATSQHGPPP